MKKIFMKIILLTFMMTCLVFALRVDAGTRSICICDQTIEKAILYRNRKYEYHVVNNEVHLNAIKKVKKVVRIPNKIKGKPVVVIEDIDDIWNIFNKVKKQRYIVQKVIIPNTVKKIGEGAFEGSETYYDKVMIKKVIFQKGSKLEEIASDAFSECHLLRKFKFPKSLKSIGDYAFYNTDLRGELILPENLETINSWAFERTKIKKVKLPRKLKNIYNGAFKRTKIEKIKIPPNIKELYCDVFSDCKKLKKVILHDDITRIYDGAFKNCESLNEIELPKGLKEIALNIFNGTGIKSLEIGKNIKKFHDLEEARPEIEVTINKKNPYFEIVDDGLYNKKITKLYRILDASDRGKFVLPNTVDKISKYAFHDVGYTEIDLGDNIEELPDYLFSKTNVKIYIGKKVKNIKDLNLKYCKNSEYVVSEENPYFKTVDGVLFNKDMTELLGFPHTSNKYLYIVPEGVKTIGEKAFNFFYKTTIEEIKLNSDLETIKSDEFGSFNITNRYKQTIHVYAGENLKEIGPVNNSLMHWHVKKGSYAEECMKEYGVEYETYE